MSDFKEIAVVKSGVNTLVKLIVGNRVQHTVIDPAAVIAVDHLAHKPEILFHSLCFPPHLLHKPKVKHIGTVQTDAVNIKFIHPETDYVKEILSHFRIGMVKTGQFKVPLPRFISKGIA